MHAVARFKTKERTAIETLFDVITMSVYRELKVRFGSSILAPVWLLLEPVGYVLTFWAIFALTGRSLVSGVTVPEFILTGALSFMYFRLSVTKCMEAVRANKAMLSYRYVTPLTCFFSRFITETIIFVSASAVLLTVIFLFLGKLTLTFSLESVITLLGFILFVGLSSLFVMCLTHVVPIITKLIPTVNRILFFMSGVFFTSTMLPDEADRVLQYNPVFVWIERLRESLMPKFVSEIEVSYIPFVLMGLFTGIAFIFKAERNRRLLDATV